MNKRNNVILSWLGCGVALTQSVNGLLLLPPWTLESTTKRSSPRIAFRSATQQQQPLQHWTLKSTKLFSNNEEEEEEEDQNAVVVEPGSENDVFTKEQWEDIQDAQPTQFAVMKELLGINIFTYILAFLILTFGSMNLVLGPGWLGGAVGIQGTGSVEQVSPNLPDTMDLNKEEYLL